MTETEQGDTREISEEGNQDPEEQIMDIKERISQYSLTLAYSAMGSAMGVGFLFWGILKQESWGSLGLLIGTIGSVGAVVGGGFAGSNLNRLINAQADLIEARLRHFHL